MSTRSYAYILRWITLAAILLNIVLGGVLNATAAPGRSIADITYLYNSLFVPAGYAFAIWGVIYLAHLLYGIVQLLPAQRVKDGYDRLNGGMIVINLLGLTWQVVFRSNKIGISVLIIAIMLITGVVLFIRSIKAAQTAGYNKWIVVPFSLFLGWISVATIANFSTWLLALGWHGGSIGEETWTIVFLAIALLLAAYISIRFTDVIYPLVITWSTYALWFALRPNHPAPANTALAVAVLSLVLAAIACARYFKTRHA
ncbi:MAG: tryptophan-rich sensory protein [Chitinophagaceae bacterium]|nr:tryptophan-rich sensory protein [Chitinophagaceae bacterium]